MKKTLMTATIILGMAVSGLCQGGGLFERGETADTDIRNNGSLILPAGHGLFTDQSAATPLGGGMLVLGALGAAYLVGKKRREE